MSGAADISLLQDFIIIGSFLVGLVVANAAAEHEVRGAIP